MRFNFDLRSVVVSVVVAVLLSVPVTWAALSPSVQRMIEQMFRNQDPAAANRLVLTQNTVDRTCADNGTAGKFTIMDATGTGNALVLCDGVTEIHRWPTPTPTATATVTPTPTPTAT